MLVPRLVKFMFLVVSLAGEFLRGWSWCMRECVRGRVRVCVCLPVFIEPENYTSRANSSICHNSPTACAVTFNLATTKRLAASTAMLENDVQTFKEENKRARELQAEKKAQVSHVCKHHDRVVV